LSRSLLPGIIRNITKKGTSDGGKSGIVPQHLENLFNEAVQERSPEETIIIAELLQKLHSQKGSSI
jgi:hypothetical protein